MYLDSGEYEILVV